MVQKNPFSLGKARRSLLHFGVGKVISAVIGVLMLVILVRWMTPSDYGVYVALVAAMEVAFIVTNGGSYSIAQRYITEARLTKGLHQLRRLAWGITWYRAATLVFFSLLLAIFSQWICSLLRLPVAPALLSAYVIVVICEGLARFVEVIFESLLEQGLTQISVISRNALRLAGYAFVYMQYDQLSLEQWVFVEIFASLFGAVLVLLLLRHHLASLPVSEAASESFSVGRLARFAMPHFAAQCLWILYSPDSVKLVTMRFLGAAQTAAFGFAHALSFVLQRYLPAQLLIGLVRPLLVAKHAGGGQAHEIDAMSNLVLKLNHFILVPAIAFFAVHRSDFAFWLSKGKQGAAGPLLVWLVGLLLLQGLHVVLSTMCAAREDGRSVLLASLAAIPGLGLGIFFSRSWGALGMIMGLWISEIMWCGVSWLLMARRGFVFHIDWRAWCKLAVAGCLAAFVAECAASVVSVPAGAVKFAGSMLLIGLAYLVACWYLKPFNDTERKKINAMLPRAVFKF